jgi:aryl-alcohol dehydrogenase-like predicted oxidoreductase
MGRRFRAGRRHGRDDQGGQDSHYGLSNETSWGVSEFCHAARDLGVPGPVTIQNSYSLVSRSVDNDLAEVLFREKMSLLAYSPLAAGMLSGKYLGGAKPPNSRFTLFDGLGQRFRSRWWSKQSMRTRSSPSGAAIAGTTRAT